MKRKAKEEKVIGENDKMINKEDWLERKGKLDKRGGRERERKYGEKTEGERERSRRLNRQQKEIYHYQR